MSDREGLEKLAQELEDYDLPGGRLLGGYEVAERIRTYAAGTEGRDADLATLLTSAIEQHRIAKYGPAGLVTNWDDKTLYRTADSALERFAALASRPVEAKPRLIWYPWVCINGHSNDHANLAPDGTKMCATPGCRAEAEANETRPASAGTEGPGMRVRPEVAWFAGEMEKQLRANIEKGGWRDCGNPFLVESARENLQQIAGGGISEDKTRTDIKSAADAANFCMMIADNCRAEIAGEYQDAALAARPVEAKAEAGEWGTLLAEAEDWHREEHNDLAECGCSLCALLGRLHFRPAPAADTEGLREALMVAYLQESSDLCEALAGGAAQEVADAIIAIVHAACPVEGEKK